jgi:hypothetical protein
MFIIIYTTTLGNKEFTSYDSPVASSSTPHLSILRIEGCFKKDDNLHYPLFPSFVAVHLTAQV